MFCVSVQEPLAPKAGLVVHGRPFAVWLNTTGGVDVEVSNAEPTGGLYVAVIECDVAVVKLVVSVAWQLVPTVATVTGLPGSGVEPSVKLTVPVHGEIAAPDDFNVTFAVETTGSPA
jgi:hypothetical protein